MKRDFDFDFDFEGVGERGAAEGRGRAVRARSPSGFRPGWPACRHQHFPRTAPYRARGLAFAGRGVLSAVGLTVALLAGGLLAPAPLSAQDDLPEGVQLKLVYETQYRDRVAVQPFRGEGVDRAAEEVHRIVQRDLDYSDRFEMQLEIPREMRTSSGDYGAWNSLGVVYLVTGSMERTETGYGLRLALHDVVYGSVKEIRHFDLPALDAPGFRMAVHRAADEVVRWATGERGIAATRVALTRLRPDGTHELLLVDSDGENVRRIHEGESIYSPSWSPDGRFVTYAETDYVESDRLVERELATGRTRVLTERGTPAQTPTYSPDGRRLALALWLDRGMEIHEYDVARDCCLRRLTRGSRIDMHPSYSPDGRRIVFQSDRLGAPHIWTMPADGGDAVLITPFETGGAGFYTSPDWSPRASRIVFTGRSRGVNQVMVADANRPGGPVQQITADGRSEDPSFAPDGRHVVFSGVRDDGMGLYVIDLVTGRIRPLVTGGRYRMPDWSPALLQNEP